VSTTAALVMISAVTTAESAPAHIFERRRSFSRALEGRGQGKGQVFEFVDQLEVSELISTSDAVTVALELLAAEIGIELVAFALTCLHGMGARGRVEAPRLERR